MKYRLNSARFYTLNSREIKHFWPYSADDRYQVNINIFGIISYPT